MVATKNHVISIVLASLKKSYSTLKKATAESDANSSSDESKSESKYDTRGVEASYLAEGQREVLNKQEIDLNKLEHLQGTDEPDRVLLGSLVVLAHDQGEENYLVLPAGAGIEVEYEGQNYTVITPASPIGENILGVELGSNVEIPQLSGGFISEIY